MAEMRKDGVADVLGATVLLMLLITWPVVVLDFIARSPGFGRVYFKDGEIIHAETHTKEGVAAFNEIVSWRGGQVIEVHDQPEPPQTIHEGWQNLLLQAVQWTDEQREKRASGG